MYSISDSENIEKLIHVFEYKYDQFSCDEFGYCMYDEDRIKIHNFNERLSLIPKCNIYNGTIELSFIYDNRKSYNIKDLNKIKDWLVTHKLTIPKKVDQLEIENSVSEFFEKMFTELRKEKD